MSSSPDHAPLVAFGAHPDDIEFGCGGIIARESRAGRPIHFVVCSRGEAGTNGTPKVRTAETQKAAKLLGATLEFLELDGDAHLEIRSAHALKLAAILRRVPYKIRMDPPSVQDFKKIFVDVCRSRRLDLPDELLSYLLEDFYPSRDVTPSAFHPKFIVDHAIAACRYQGLPPSLTMEAVEDALNDLVVADSPSSPRNRPTSGHRSFAVATR